MWLREHGQTSKGKDVAPRGRARTDYVGEKVTVLIVCSLTNIRGRFKLYPSISRDSINKCLLFFNSGCFCHHSHCFGQNVTRSTESFFKQWASVRPCPTSLLPTLTGRTGSPPAHTFNGKGQLAGLAWRRGSHRLERGRKGEAGLAGRAFQGPRMVWMLK